MKFEELKLLSKLSKMRSTPRTKQIKNMESVKRSGNPLMRRWRTVEIHCRILRMCCAALAWINLQLSVNEQLKLRLNMRSEEISKLRGAIQSHQVHQQMLLSTLTL
jgi:hypothetical protein